MPFLNQVILLWLFFKIGSFTSILDWRPWSFMSEEFLLNFFKLVVVTFLKDRIFKLLIVSKFRVPKKLFPVKLMVWSSWFSSLTFLSAEIPRYQQTTMKIFWMGSISSASVTIGVPRSYVIRFIDSVIVCCRNESSSHKIAKRRKKANFHNQWFSR